MERAPYPASIHIGAFSRMNRQTYIQATGLFIKTESKDNSPSRFESFLKQNFDRRPAIWCQTFSEETHLIRIMRTGYRSTHSCRQMYLDPKHSHLKGYEFVYCQLQKLEADIPS